jgi:catechol 2,3-dioxygenase-like lactoylglutathione lyase family enzyme
MRFGHLELGVSDPIASREFYTTRLGFVAVADQGPGFQWIEREGLEILLRKGPPSPGVSIVYYTDRPETEAERLRAAGADVTLVASCWHVRDPDGHLIQVVDPAADHSDDQ